MSGAGEVHTREKREGFGFPITTRRILTAYHVVRDAVRNQTTSELSYVPHGGGAPVPVVDVRPDEDHDVALLELAFDVATSYRPSTARLRAPWHVDTRWLPNDPRLTGAVEDPARLRRRGVQEVPFIQLGVTQTFSTYKGYSGSPVLDDNENVIGVLSAQALDRGQTQSLIREAANVLFATSLDTVAELFGLRSEVSARGVRVRVIDDEPRTERDRTALSWSRRAPFAHDPGATVTWAAFNSDGRVLMTAGSDGAIRAWDLAADDEANTPLRPRHELAWLTLSGEGSRIAVAGRGVGDDRGYHVSAWALGGGVSDLDHVLPSPPADVALSADGRYLAIAAGDGLSGIWDLEQPLAPQTRLPEYTVKVAFSPDGRHFACRSTRTGVSIWRTDEGRLGRRIPVRIGTGDGPPGDGLPARQLAFSLGGRWLLSRIEDVTDTGWRKRGSIWLHDAHTGEPIGTPLKHPAVVEHVTTSPGDTLLATACRDKKARIWALHENRELEYSCDAYPAQVAIGPDACFLAAACLDHVSVRVWPWPTDSVEPAEDLPHPYPVTAIAVSRDGHLAVSGGDHTTVWSWHP